MTFLNIFLLVVFFLQGEFCSTECPKGKKKFAFTIDNKKVIGKLKQISDIHGILIPKKGQCLLLDFVFRTSTKLPIISFSRKGIYKIV